MSKFLMRTMLLCAISLAAVSCKTLVDPCDVLVEINTQTSTNSYLVQNDRKAAEGLARHKGRFYAYKCSADSTS